MAASTNLGNDDLLVEVINNEEDFTDAYHCLAQAFGAQIHDAIWTAFNPGWDTPSGAAAGAARLARRWKNTTYDKQGNPNAVFLKATLPDPEGAHAHSSGGSNSPGRVTAGFAIWVQISAVEGRGDTSLGAALDAAATKALYPDNETEQRFLQQMFRSLFKSRVAFVKDQADAAQPAVMTLDLCATHPGFQRRGVASALVRWGLEEARRRGMAYATTEASSMGRHVYARLGFRPQGSDIVYEVDEEFRDREKPSNLFMVNSLGADE
ncbi:acyl-CoA N-acyltransferase [Xylaria sp. FL0933]|nr:acyl-CoA N-acyltransferase [Xylaria sp. FL0933]